MPGRASAVRCLSSLTTNGGWRLLVPRIQQNCSRTLSPLCPCWREPHLIGWPRSSLASVRRAAMKRRRAANLKVMIDRVLSRLFQEPNNSQTILGFPKRVRVLLIGYVSSGTTGSPQLYYLNNVRVAPRGQWTWPMSWSRSFADPRVTYFRTSTNSILVQIPGSKSNSKLMMKMN